MASSFPNSLDNFSNPTSGDKLDSPSHSSQHSDANDAIEGLETKLGIGASPAGSATAGYAFVHSSGGTTGWSQVGYEGITSGTAIANQILTAQGGGTAIWATPSAVDSDVYFAARISTNQSFNNATWTKIQFDTEIFDSGTVYDPTTNYRFTVPTGKGGRYLFGVDVAWGIYNAGHQVQLAFYKNGSNVENNIFEWRDSGSDVVSTSFTKLLNLSAGDYVEAFANQNRGVAATLYSPNANFWGYKI
jgi:hypothetical protein